MNWKTWVYIVSPKVPQTDLFDVVSGFGACLNEHDVQLLCLLLTLLRRHLTAFPRIKFITGEKQQSFQEFCTEKKTDKFDQINLKFLQGSWETMFIAHEPVMDQQLFSKKINAFNMSKPKIQRQKEISRGVTDRLSERSVLFPTNMISTSPPRSVLTSSIHFDVWWNEFASELQGNKYDINRWPTNRYHKIPVLKQLLFCMDCKQCNQHTINQHLTIKSIKLRKGQGRNFSNAQTLNKTN